MTDWYPGRHLVRCLPADSEWTIDCDRHGHIATATRETEAYAFAKEHDEEGEQGMKARSAGRRRASRLARQQGIPFATALRMVCCGQCGKVLGEGTAGFCDESCRGAYTAREFWNVV